MHKRRFGPVARDELMGASTSREMATVDFWGALARGAEWIGGASVAKSSPAAFSVPSATGFEPELDPSDIRGKVGFRIVGENAFDHCGNGVASAGDVNGDGIADLLVGAWRASPGGDQYAGQTYVIFGTTQRFKNVINLGTIDGINGFRLDGIDAGDECGKSIASAGDINGDGFGDIVIGIAGADRPGMNSVGESYVVFGKAGGFAAHFDLAALDGANGFRLDGIAIGDRSGWAVSSAGDLNADGYDDILIGAFGGNQFAGEGYVVFGSDAGFEPSMNLSTLDGSNGFRINAVHDDTWTGAVVSLLGDVNHDGFDDIAIGAPYDTVGGRAYVLFGSPLGFAANVDLADLDGVDGFRIVGVPSSDRIGWTAAGAGDVNGDGIDDLILGAFRSTPGSHPDAAYVIFGQAAGFGASIELENLDGRNGYRIIGNAFEGNPGYRVAGAGDVNGDGFDDVIVGSPHRRVDGINEAGSAYVIFGKADQIADDIDLRSLNEADGFRLDGNERSGFLGINVSAAGDLNGDGFDDIAVGASPSNVDGREDAGETYVIFGQAPTEAVERVGSAADQVIRGSAFADTLRGGAGDDSLHGSMGNDIFDGGAGADAMNGGSRGLDWVDYSSALGKVVADLKGPTRNQGEAAGDSYFRIENLRGSSFSDTLHSNKRDTRIEGLSGNDWIGGRRGDDTLVGGAGRDRLKGGAGSDRFVFDNIGDNGADLILDFTPGEDVVALRPPVFGLAPGQLGASNFRIGDAAEDFDDRIIYDPSDGSVYFDPDGNGFAAQVLIATIANLAPLSAQDFVVGL